MWLRMARDGAGGDPFFETVFGGTGAFLDAVFALFGGGPLGGGVPFFMVTFLGGGPLGGGGGI